MTHRRPLRLAVVLGGLTTLPALAHMTSAAAPHWHAGDAWGVLAVIALTGAAAWLERRGR